MEIYINRNRNNFEKIKILFSCFEFLQNVKDVEFEKNSFLSDSDINSKRFKFYFNNLNNLINDLKYISY